MAELIYKDEVYAIAGAAMEVYNTLGAGFSEGVYQEALEIELNLRNIPNKPQMDVFIEYKGQTQINPFPGSITCKPFAKISVD